MQVEELWKSIKKGVEEYEAREQDFTTRGFSIKPDWDVILGKVLLDLDKRVSALTKTVEFEEAITRLENEVTGLKTQLSSLKASKAKGAGNGSKGRAGATKPKPKPKARASKAKVRADRNLG